MALPNVVLKRDTSLELHAAATATTSAPSADTDADFSTKQYSRFRLLFDYGTAPAALNIRLYVWDKTLAKWFRLGDTDEVDVLVPTKGDESRDFFVGRGSYVHVQIQAISGASASVTINAIGVDSGAELV